MNTKYFDKDKDVQLKKTTQFRHLLNSGDLEFLLEAHNGITAKIGEEAGFKALWAGGLCMSAQYGVRDSNEASWTQVLEMLEFMADATSIPILLDGDTGYGNFNNVRRLVRKLEQRGIAAVCIEDKLYPKTNSFIDGNKQQLAEIDEFCSRIKAGKDAQADDEFAIITRVEAFIAGWGLDEALKRAEAYHEAGSDGILIHSALSTPTEVLAFKREWADRSPVVIVPTKYYATPTDVLREAGFSIAIWANHMLRAAITTMQECAETLAREQNLRSVEDQIASVKEIFRLQGASELQDAEERYLPKQTPARAVILAASRGSALGALTDERPKAMVEVRGQPLLGHIVAAYNASKIKDITVVRGYRPEAVNLPALNYVDNLDFADTGELLSLDCALKAMDTNGQVAQGDLYISFGEVIFKRHLYYKQIQGDGLHSEIDRMKKEKLVVTNRVRFVIVTNFEHILAIDTKTFDSLDLAFSELPRKFDFFLPWAGMEKAVYQGENPADVKAAEKMVKLFDFIKADNFNESNEDDTDALHNLNVFLTRLLFCYFAEESENQQWPLIDRY